QMLHKMSQENVAVVRDANEAFLAGAWRRRSTSCARLLSDAHQRACTLGHVRDAERVECGRRTGERLARWLRTFFDTHVRGQDVAPGGVERAPERVPLIASLIESGDRLVDVVGAYACRLERSGTTDGVRKPPREARGLRGNLA